MEMEPSRDEEFGLLDGARVSVSSNAHYTWAGSWPQGDCVHKALLRKGEKAVKFPKAREIQEF